MSEIIVNSKTGLSTEIENLLNVIETEASSLDSEASFLSSIQNCDDIDLSSAGKTILNNFDSIFTDYTGVAQTMSNYINNLIALDIDDFNGTTATSATAGGNVTYTAGEMLSGGLAIPLYYQQDYEDISLGYTSDVAEGGCGFTSCSMVASYLTGQTITPREFVDDWSERYFIDDVGMDWGLPAATAEHYGLGEVKATTDIDEVVAALQNNQPVVSSQGYGTFSRGEGHIIALRGVTEDGQILVNDPDSYNSDNNTMAFDPSEVDRNAANYWIFEAKK